MELVAELGASLAKVPNEGWGAFAALIGVVGAFFRVLPQSEARPKGMAFSRLQVETARSRATELWMPAAARISDLIVQMETDPQLKAQAETFHAANEIATKPFSALIRPSVWAGLFRLVFAKPKVNQEANLALATACIEAAREQMSGGRIVLMPPRIHRRLVDLREFATGACESREVVQQFKLCPRGSDPLVAGAPIGSAGSSAHFYELNLGQRYLSNLSRLPKMLLIVPAVYIGLIISVVTLGYVQLKTIVLRGSVRSPLFASAVLGRLRGLEADMQRLNAG